VYIHLFSGLVLTVAVAHGQAKLDFVTQLPGSDSDQVRAMALDPDGNIFVAGSTRSPDLATPGAAQVRGSRPMAVRC
jgi:hypothetical protein